MQIEVSNSSALSRLRIGMPVICLEGHLKQVASIKKFDFEPIAFSSDGYHSAKAIRMK